MKAGTKRQVGSFFYTKGFVLVVILFIILLVVALIKEYNRQEKVDQKIFELEEEAADLEDSNLELARLINYLQSDEFVELEARKNLGYKKAGENVLVIEGMEENNQMLKKKEDKNNFEKWLDYFLFVE